MKAGNVEQLQFALMWANHDWGNCHPIGRGQSIQHSVSGRVGGAEFEKMTDLIIERYFHHPSYLKIDGAPFFSIYALNNLVLGFGGSLDDTRAALVRFAQKTVTAGFRGLHLNGIGCNVQVLDGELGKHKTVNAAEMLGFASVGHYVWAHFVPLSGPDLTKDFSGARAEYIAALEKNQTGVFVAGISQCHDGLGFVAAHRSERHLDDEALSVDADPCREHPRSIRRGIRPNPRLRDSPRTAHGISERME